MNKISYDLKLLQETLRYDRREKPPRHCGLCSVSYMCNYDIDKFCFWKKEYQRQVIEEILE